VVDWGIACLLTAGPKSVALTMDAANCAAVLLSMPISYHFHGCTALLVALVVVSGAILNTHLYLEVRRYRGACSTGGLSESEQMGFPSGA